MPLPADAVPAWLWLPGVAAGGTELTLDPADAHYVARVCRAAPGDRLHATDGEGAIATLEVLAVRGEVRLAVVSTRREPEPTAVVVACGAPEKDRADWMVEKLAELGVTVLVPLDCDRGRWERWESRLDRLQRLATAALRQSRGAWRLRLGTPVTPADWTASLPVEGARWLADPEGDPPEWSAPDRAEFAAIGPSSGFSGAERQHLVDSGFRPVRLAAGRLRTETAALAWASLRAASGGRPA